MASSQQLTLASSSAYAIQLGLPGIWTATSWEPPAELSFEDWAAIGPALSVMEGAVHWWIGDWINAGSKRYERGRYDEALDHTGFEKGTLNNDAWVARKLESSRRREDLSWGHHRVVAPFDDPAEQSRWLARAAEHGWSVHELRRAIRHQHLADPPSLPAGTRYRIFYADPPWHYDQVIDKYGPAERHYPTMTVDELSGFGANIADIAEDNAVLFLWSTAPKLKDALQVAESWGFRYTGAQFIWDKVRHNYGHYNSVRHELLLICTRGSCLPDTNQLVDSVQTVERTPRHSEKPAQFREIIDTLYVFGRRIELFARDAADGWDSWGLEAPPEPGDL